jgi:hypothetical protein
VQLPYEGYFEQLARILYPTRFREKFYLVMYGCYLDESFDKKPLGVYMAGGFIGQGVPTFELERNWENCLKRHGLAYYKASHCERGGGQFEKFLSNPPHITDSERKKLDSISREFCEIIGHPVQYDPRVFFALYGTAVLQDDFYDIIKDSNARAILGNNPYWVAYVLAMAQAAWAMQELGEGKPDHCAAFVCDEDEEHAETAPIAYGALKKANPIAARYMGTYSTADEKGCAPLQAADAIVYGIRKALKYSRKDYEVKLREQFGMFADSRIMFYIGHTAREQLEWIVANHKPGEPLKIDELMKWKAEENIDTIRK